MNPIPGAVLSVTTFLVACIIALGSHEIAHVFSAWALSVRVKRIGISWRGPYIVREQGAPLTNACIALAGPIANLVLSLLSWNVAPTFAQVNLVLGLFNLVPMQGTDGSHAWLSFRRASNMLLSSNQTLRHQGRAKVQQTL